MEWQNVKRPKTKHILKFIKQHKPKKRTIFWINIQFLLSPTSFEPRGFVLSYICVWSTWMVCFACVHRSISNIPCCILNCLPEDEPKSFDTLRRKEKLNINLENCAFLWFVLYNYTKMHGARNIKIILKHWNWSLKMANLIHTCFILNNFLLIIEDYNKRTVK